MPVIKKSAPLMPEGEYVGQARKVSQGFVKAKNGEEIAIFRVPLHTIDGKVITPVIRVTDSTGWVFDQLCKSGNMSLPDTGEDYQITCDDLERRVFYFGVVHNKGDDGRTFANVKFHARSYALQQNPALAGITFPLAASPVTLRPASTQASSPAEAATVPPPPSAVAPSSVPADAENEGGISPEEFAQAVAYARSLKTKKQEAPTEG
jgi:hypothetical protein